MSIQPVINLLNSIRQECDCHESYTSRDLTDPQCQYHSIGAEEIEAVKAWVAGYLYGKAFLNSKDEREV